MDEKKEIENQIKLLERILARGKEINRNEDNNAQCNVGDNTIVAIYRKIGRLKSKLKEEE